MKMMKWIPSVVSVTLLLYLISWKIAVVAGLQAGRWFVFNWEHRQIFSLFLVCAIIGLFIIWKHRRCGIVTLSTAIMGLFFIILWHDSFSPW